MLQADPLSSREFVLVSNLLETAWRSGQSLDLGSLIGQVQTPPFRKLGVFDLDTFFPQKERMALALKLNALIASPAFAAWSEGQALDPGALLRTADGKPRAAIIYLAHLSDEERQFVVTLVLSKLVTWMRGQPGTSDLRTLVYMDEVFGFVPPTAAPPAKKPILTILKQGRAFGVGIVLSTQNPVDLDYKAMANAGTWLVGRLQTENDKARVLEGLRSAAGGADIGALDAAIGGLQKREFMLVSAKAKDPALFMTRWAMSYLRGPLTKDQVSTLMKGRAATRRRASRPHRKRASPRAHHQRHPSPPRRSMRVRHRSPPPVAAGIAVGYLDPAASWAAQVGAVAGGTKLEAYLAARVGVRFDDSPGAGGRAAGVRSALRLSAGASTWTPRSWSTTTTATSTALSLPARPIRCRPHRSATPRSFGTRSATSRDISSTPRCSSSTGTPSSSSCPAPARLRRISPCAATTRRRPPRTRKPPRSSKSSRVSRRSSRRLSPWPSAASKRSAPISAPVRRTSWWPAPGPSSGRYSAGAAAPVRSPAPSSSAASRRGMSARTAAAEARPRRRRSPRHEDELHELEQQILDEVQAIDAKWKAVAAQIDTVAIHPEATDVRVERIAVVWVPTA